MKVESSVIHQLRILARLIRERLQMRLRPKAAFVTPPSLPVVRAKGGLVQGLDGLSNKAMLDAADRIS